MTKHCATAASGCRIHPLAAGIAALLGLSLAPAALATNRIVTSCLDDGSAGTLRNVITAPSTVSGDEIDLTQLTNCANSKITLATGGMHIPISQNNLTIKGPPNATLTIDGSQLDDSPYNYSNLLYHTGTGTLSVSHLTLTGGHEKHQKIDALGGCVYSKANIDLAYVTISNCTDFSEYNTARGGAVYAGGNLALNHSAIGSSSASGVGARGGGVFAKGTLTLASSTLSGNSADSGGDAFGGGAYAVGSVLAQFSHVDGNDAASTFGNASGGGIFAKSTLTLTQGSLNDNSLDAHSYARGGGAYAIGNIVAAYSQITGNTVTSTESAARGGGFDAKGNLSLQVATLSGNSVAGSSIVYSSGGGARTRGEFHSSYSTISGNIAYGLGFGGGLTLTGPLNVVVASTISGNTSHGGFGGIDVFTGGAPQSYFVLRNSTVSGNHASGGIGGLYTDTRTTAFYNSTIAFNTAAVDPGVKISASSAAVQVTLQSTLISNNTFGSSENDLTTVPGSFSVTFNGGNLATPANNFVRVTSATGLPTDTKDSYCPLLGPLRDNGGLTKTHALLSGSQAIDAGNNNSLFFFDQRGTAVVNGTLDYPRVSGALPKADIGAFEVQHDEIVFNAGFEGCPALPF